MGVMYCPVETSGWGDCELFDADGSFFMVDTWTNGATKIRSFVRSKLGRRKMALIISHGHKDHNGDYRYYIVRNLHFSDVTDLIFRTVYYCIFLHKKTSRSFFYYIRHPVICNI